MNNLWSILIVNIILLVSSSSQTWSSPALSKFMNSTTSPFGRALDQNEVTWMVSSLTLGSVVGNWIFCYLATTFGRKKMFLTAGVVQLVCNLMIAFGNIIEIFYIARIIMGSSVTGILFLMPVYIGELGDKSKIPLYISIASLASCVGLLLPNAVGPFISITTLSLILVGFLLLFLVVFTIFGKETPQYYISLNKKELAKQILMNIKKDEKQVEEALLEMQTIPKTEYETFYDLYSSKAFRKSFLIVNGFLIFQQLSGFDVTIFYGLQLFQNFHSGITPEMSVVIFDLFHLSGGLPMLVISYKFQRKTLLLISGLGMAASQIGLVMFIYIQKFYDFPKALDILSLLFLLCFIFMFNIGFGPFPFLMLGEILPANVQFLVISITGSVYSIVAFFLTKNFYNMLNLIGLQGYFLMCSLCCCLAVLFTKFYMIETKDKTLKEIQLELQEKKRENIIVYSS